MARRYDKPWKVIASFALLLAAGSLFLSVLLFGIVQQSRRDNIIRACKDTNERNRSAFTYLQGFPQQPGAPKRTPKEQRALIHGFTDALVGKPTDCRKRADRLTR